MTDLSTHYLPGLVIVSFGVAIFASFVALDMVNSLAHAKGLGKVFWLTGGSFAMGSGIWSMHFIGMLAFEMPGMTMGYDINLLLLSIGVAIAGAGFALYIMSRSPVSKAALTASAFAMAAAIAGMHYIGMFSMRMEAVIEWNRPLVVLSLLIALAASFWALIVASELTTIKYSVRVQAAASVLLGFAIAGMHYVGMQAAHFHHADIQVDPNGFVLASSQLTIIVVGVTLMILSLALSGSTIDRLLTRRELRERNHKQKAQEAEIANELKTQFLANMSHEIRTPLGSIIGFTQVLLEEPLTENQRKDHLRTVLRSARALLGLLDDILDLSKIEMNKLEIENRDFDLRNFLTELVGVFAIKTEAKGLKIELIIDPLLPKKVNSDSNRLRQILMNLIGNAVKFTTTGGIKITVRPEGLNLVAFEIEDTGIGLSPNQVEKIFKPFTQADNSTSRLHGGTGLGLDIAKRIAEILGGTVVVLKSNLGVGTTFVATIRLEKSKNQSVAEPSSVLSFPSKELRNLKVLVVDDNEDNQSLIHLILTTKGALVSSALDGSQGVRQATESLFDVILMDIQMPVMNGYEAIEAIRTAGIKTPIVALTANAYKQERDKCFKSGCDAYITKPIDVRELVVTLKNLVENHRS